MAETIFDYLDEKEGEESDDPRYVRLDPSDFGGLTSEQQSELIRKYGQDAGRVARAGLEGERLFEHASKLARIGAGEEKTEAQVRSERALEILTGAQRGASAKTGFDVAESLRAGERAAQRSEVVGEAKIAEGAEFSRQAAREQLEGILIQGEQRAADKAFAMQQLAFQKEQAEDAMWGNVLAGILGATGAIIGGAFGNAPGAIAGGAAGGALGQSAGEWLA